ncbi:AraC family ligand binding domain-containing protein [Shewanella sp. C32]|uniref:AraC family ligand binding domain-containing protein n=1 Tax=Shewanella electrica TaxID=515560 RepID=A0ABT2FPU1_9GAMM|nr:AraC family ligand binding domain-containing protein [Shewanella electrica]MCH1927047.1 AraC family ligand binding domain-containing protein [Shewanella electrica]MCS4557987.1 AraC family ligand binding domain-containing protein [Shewanella electrica]
MSEPAVTIQHRLVDSLPGVELVQANYQQFSFDRHVHDDIHIGVVDIGAQRFMHKGQHYLLAPERISLINPDEVHDGQGMHDQHYRVQLLRISSAALAEFGRSLGVSRSELFLRGPEIEDAELYQQLLALHYAHQHRDSSSPLAQDSQMTAVLALLLQRYAQQTTAKHHPEPLARVQLQQLKQYLLADLSKPHRLAELAALFDLSEYQFLRRFRASIGMTPHAYVLALRVDYGRQLLKQRLALTDAATLAGFYDQSHFTHAFKRRYNLTPAVYQQQLHQTAVFYKT